MLLETRDFFFEHEQTNGLNSPSSVISRSSSRSRGYRRDGFLIGYAGHFPVEPPETHILDSPNKKVAIRGYSGFRPNIQNVVGKPLIPSEVN